MNRMVSLAVALSLVLSSCRSLGSSHRAYVLDTSIGKAVPFEQMVADLAHADVVFLGENHDSAEAHRWQLRTLEELYALRPNLVLSMEMFERDDQVHLDAYLSGTSTEAEFLEAVREWPNYVDAYRPGVEFAKAHGLHVLAANCPRSLASKVYKEGLDSVAGDPLVAAKIDTRQNRYFEVFQAMLGGDASHGAGDNSKLVAMYDAQCVKDDTMAESIAERLRGPGEGPLVVHWCGRGHSDYRLGTVERLAARAPHHDLVVVSIVTRDESKPDDPKDMADYLWIFGH